jgi:hypothetical protein
MKKSQWMRLSVMGLLVGAACAPPAEEGPDAPEVDDPSAQLTAAETRLTTDAWVRQPGSTSEDKVWAVAAGANEVYAVGHTCGTFENVVTAGGCDAFLVRYDVTGANPRVTPFGSSADDRARGVAVCPNGTVYVAGTTKGSLTTGAPVDAVGGNFFVTRFDPNGTRRWTVQAGTTAEDTVLALAADCTRSRVYVVGQTHGAFTGASAMGEGDAFLAQLTDSGTAGAVSFVRQLGSARAELAQAVAVDTTGDVYLAGTTYGALNPTTVVRGVPNSVNQDASGASGDAFVARYDVNGALQDFNQRGTALNDSATGLALVPTSGGTLVYVAGSTEGALDGQTSKGAYDAILLRYSAGASPKTLQWVATRQEGGVGHELALGLASSADGLLYMTGRTESNLFTGAFNNPVSHDIFLMRFDPSGNRLQPTWQLDSIRNSNDLSAPDEFGHGVAVDGDSNVYVGGFTEWQLGGNTNKGGTDAVVARFIDGCPLGSSARGCAPGTSWGDPHFITFDGPTHHYQGAGDFIGVKQADATAELLVHARQCPGNNPLRQVSYNRVVATKMGADTLVFQHSNALPLLVRPALSPEGSPDVSTSALPSPVSLRSAGVDSLSLPNNTEAVSLATGATRLLAGGSLHRRAAGEYVVRWWTGERLSLKVGGGSITYTMFLPEARKGKVQGLLGNYNGVTTDDGVNPSSWRVSSGSLFPTSGLATPDCTNLAFPGPSSPVETSPYYAEAQSACNAAAACVDKESCILDYVSAREEGLDPATVIQACSDVGGLPSYTLLRTAGRPDDFATADGTESPLPSPVLKTWVNGWYGANPSIRDFDTLHGDQVWAHTFPNLTPRTGYVACGGTLELRTYTNDPGDAIGMPFLDAAGTQISSDRFFFAYLSAVGSTLGQSKTYSLDLTRMPGGNGPMNVLPQLEERGQLDVYIQDDSGVDFVNLTVKYCRK